MHRPILITALAALAASSAFGQASKSAIAQTEMATLADALALVYLDTNYYTTLENLNDLPNFPTVVDYDYIDDNGGALAIRPFAGTFGSNPRVEFMDLPATFAWQGPYVAYQAGTTDGPSSDYDEGTPLDPWGEPYWFYTPMGLVEPITETVSLRFYGDDFADYRVVSHGPDGEFGGGDDLDRFVAFHLITSRAISSVRVTSGAPAKSARGMAAWTATFKGFNFGATQGTGGVAADAVPLVVDSWSDNLVVAALATFPAPGTTFTLTRNGGQVLTFAGFVDETGAAGVGEWRDY